jgi:hypothetical protein
MGEYATNLWLLTKLFFGYTLTLQICKVSIFYYNVVALTGWGNHSGISAIRIRLFENKGGLYIKRKMGK